MCDIIQKFAQMLAPERLIDSNDKFCDEIGLTVFDDDYNCMIVSASVRRLQDKAQVFPLERTDFLRTRLTHSLEVANVGMQLGAYVEKLLCKKYKAINILDEEFIKRHYISKILQVAGLLHDIGNPPYGHYGEQAIRDYFVGLKQAKSYKDELKIEKTVAALIGQSNVIGEENEKGGSLNKFFDQATLSFSRTNSYTSSIADAFDKLTEAQKADFLYFDGNVQTLRLLTHLRGSREDAVTYNLTTPVLSTIIKYPFSSTAGNKPTGSHMQSKFGYFYSEEDEYLKIIHKLALQSGQRHPLTFLLEAADDITYTTSDIEDGFRYGVIRLNDIVNKLLEASRKNGDEDNLWKRINVLLGDKVALNENEELPQVEKEYLVRKVCNVVQQEMIKASAISFVNNFTDIVNGNFDKEILKNSDSSELKNVLDKLAIQNFSDYRVVKRELLGGKVIATLMNEFVQALFDENITKLNKDKREINRKSKAYKLYSLISPNYKKEALGEVDEVMFLYDGTNQYAYEKFQLVTDFVAGMTDKYALQIYHDLIG